MHIYRLFINCFFWFQHFKDFGAVLLFDTHINRGKCNGLINPLTPEIFEKKSSFWTFWTFLAWI